MNATTNQRQRAVRIEIGAEARSYVSEGQRVTLVPLTIKRRQNRKLLIPPAPEISDRIGGFDVPMIKTLGKAFYWKAADRTMALPHDNGLGARHESGTGLGCRGSAHDHAGPRYRGGDIRRTSATPPESAHLARPPRATTARLGSATPIARFLRRLICFQTHPMTASHVLAVCFSALGHWRTWSFAVVRHCVP
jgi:hypothetical protein